MRRRPLLWLSVSILCFVAASYFWRLGDKWAAEKAAASRSAGTNDTKAVAPATRPVAGHAQNEPIRLFSELQPEPPAAAAASNATPATPLDYRLSNTPQKLGELARSDKAILLENALLDTARSTELPIPGHLRAQGDPGAYIVQSRKPLDNAFRSLLQQAGATIIAYIPNNAYLVRASRGVAQGLAAQAQTRTVLPYEPYYKLKPALLQLAVEQQPLPGDLDLNLLLFADAREATLKSLKEAGVPVLAETRSPFGPVVKVQPPVDGLPALAGLPGVQGIEAASARVLANDLSRATLGVAADTVTPLNYLGLTGTNVLINITDTGVDATHPDLTGRVLIDLLDNTGLGASDTNGHGTHVAGIIAGDGSKSTTVTSASGSILPAVGGQFRGKAPGATLFSLPWSADHSYLQETAARTNAFISNNSWTYGTADYNLAAASYDAAVRDSLPTVSGSQPLLYVFPAGNGGSLRRPSNPAFEGGIGGSGDGILSPGTAKNVITVGAVEQARNVTNEIERISGGIRYTNTPWVTGTDATNQVASYSSRGNVGIEYEGKYGRFKPDVVAPGSFVLSTRSSTWDEETYYNPTNYHSRTRLDVVNTNQLRNFINFIPENAVQWTIDVSPDYLPIYVKQSGFPTATSYDLTGTNFLSLPPDRALNPVAQNWCFSIGNNTNQPVIYTVTTTIVTTNDYGNYLEVLSNLNNTISGSAPHFYRYESGTSMAAADVAGTLGLMQEFFEQRMHQTNSPALMKALLINGARSLGNGYDLQVTAGINYQGWGQVQLPTSISSNLLATAGAMSRPAFLFDQSPTNALATAQSQTRFFSLNPEGRNQPLRVTLVWTDPPGNPITSIKLVNDLDLVVTNLDTGDVFFGNDIISGMDFNSAWDTNNPPNVDFVNNVENVYLQEPLGTNYSVTVVARHVNVNAVAAHTNDVVQDFALVVSSGDGAVPDALTLTANPPRVSAYAPYVTIVTNSFPTSADNPTSGGLLLNQHVGANTPLMGTNQVPLEGANISAAANGVITLGMTNQWHFYVLSNDFNYTNAAFVVFMPPNLSVPRMGVNVPDPNDASRLEADIDLYVSTDPNLTNLSPTAIANAEKSVSRGGTEIVVKSNAQPATVYYVGIKSEDQQAAEYGFLGVFSLYPFSTTDDDGNQYLRGVPGPTYIPNGTMLKPNAAMVFGIGILPMNVRRVVVTNGITHDSVGDLLGILSHNHKFATLNNHSCAHDPSDPNRCLTSYSYVYEDNGEGNIPGSKPSDGPGTLKNFVGEQGLGLWVLNMVNSSLAYTGQVDNLFIKLEPQNLDEDGVPRDVLPHTFSYDFIDVPANATNLTVCVTGNTDPMELYVRRADFPTQTTFDYHLTINPPGDCLPITIYDIPPLTPGRYYIGVYNPSSTTQHIRLTAKIYKNPFAIPTTISGFSSPVTLLDNAVTRAYLHMTNNGSLPIADLDVSLLINHPRISDLAITLVSPNGTRVVLFEDRGAAWTNGLGTFNAGTNGLGLPAFGNTNLVAFWTNDFERSLVGPYAPGAVFQGWSVLTNFVAVEADLAAPWLSNNVLVLGDGVVSNSLPTTNSTAYSLSYKVTHAPYLVGTVGWWPLDGDGADIFGGFNGLLFGNVLFTNGLVNQAYFGDGLASRMIVPRAPALDVGQRRGFAIEGWINPTDIALPATTLVMSNSFEGLPDAIYFGPTNVFGGWFVETGGTIEVQTQGHMAPPGLPDSGHAFIDINGWNPGNMWTNVALVPGEQYVLRFAFTRNPDSQKAPSSVPTAAISLNGTRLLTVAPGWSNSWSYLNWQTTSTVFTATSTSMKLALQGLNASASGVLFDSLSISEAASTNASPFAAPAPLVEWFDVNKVTNSPMAAFTSVPLQNATATFSQTASGDFSVERAIDGNSADNLGWAIQFGIGPQTAVFETVTNVGTAGGSVFTFTLIQNAYWTYHPDTLGRFRLSVTTDDRSTFADGLTRSGDVTANWTVLEPISFTSTNGATLTRLSDNSILAGGLAPDRDVYTVVAQTPLANITGVRLEVLTDPSLPFGGPGREPANGNFVLSEFQMQAAPLQAPENPAALGVQFWLGDLSHSNSNPGILSAAIWDTNSQPHYIGTLPAVLTNGGWQHVALSYDAFTRTARLYTNGQLAVAQVVSTTNFVPRTSGDLFFGFHSVNSTTFSAFAGGLDEFALYQRPLSDCEVAAIFRAGLGGKYGTNVLTCPVTSAGQLLTSVGTLNFAFTNGYAWSTNGPAWETNTIYFTNLLQAAFTNGPATNVTALILQPLNPNVQVDDFILSALQTNYVNGLLNFTDNTNLALLPIKFAPAPYLMSNFPPTLIFSNDFENVIITQQVYQVDAVLPGSTNDPAYGPRDWTVSAGSISVVSNTVFDSRATNWVALAGGSVQCLLPTTPGHRYQLTYHLRGPGAVSWWSGDIEPLSQRAWDLLSGNHGAFLDLATNTTAALVGGRAFYFNGMDTNGLGSKLDLGDPPSLALTNALTIEGWVHPIKQTNYFGTEQILFRGDRRGDTASSLFAPYYLALEPYDTASRDLRFHIADTTQAIELFSTNAPISVGQWQHVAAVFEMNVPVPGRTWTTNQLRLYLNGTCIASNYTALTPFRDLDPAFSAGAAIGNRSRTDYSQPFRGYLDELSVYGRALTDPEIAVIAARGGAGKADFTVQPAVSLASVNVLLDNVLVDQGYGDNARWTTRTVNFAASRTNMVLNFQSLQPGTLLDGITLTELPAELNYMPEQPLSVLNGEDGYGTWILEIWDTRAGAADTNSLPSLLNWVLNFTLLPSNAPPVIQLAHGIPYTNSLTAHGVQNFVVQVPQWATMATNQLLFAVERNNPAMPLPVGVFFALTNSAPGLSNSALFAQPFVTAGTSLLTTNTNAMPHLVIGQPYYLTVSNPNPVAVSFALGNWFDIISLTNCVAQSNYVGLAGIPRYFQIDVTNVVPDNLPSNFPPQQVVFHLTGIESNYVGFRSNVTVVLSQHLPLPDLRHYDYISHDVRTNDDVIMVLTNSTPFPIQTNRWYIGVFNNAATNVPFTIEACYTTNVSPMIVPLTDSVPRTASAPPGPPKWLFYEFEITDNVEGVLFELYNASGDVDLVLQRDGVPGMATYLDGSFRAGQDPEQIVLRRGAEYPDLRGKWYLGVYNNEARDVTYTIRAALPHDGVLLSGLNIPILARFPLPPPRGIFVSWHAVVGELYAIDYSPTIPPRWQKGIGYVRATTPVATFEDTLHVGASQAYYRVRAVAGIPATQPTLVIQPWTGNQVRLSWSTNFAAAYRQTATSVLGPWSAPVTNWPITIVNSNYVILEPIGATPRFYRLTQ